ncbi:hypothetical protein D3C71_1895070 [compost metagenome]
MAAAKQPLWAQLLIEQGDHLDIGKIAQVTAALLLPLGVSGQLPIHRPMLGRALDQREAVIEGANDRVLLCG